MRVWIQSHCSTSLKAFLALKWVIITVHVDLSSKRDGKNQGLWSRTTFTVSWCVSSHTTDKKCDPPREWSQYKKHWLQQDREFNISQYHSNLLEFVFNPWLSWICSMWQREATYLVHLVQPYPVRGGETDRTEEGGKWNCGKRHSAALRGRERGGGGGGVVRPWWTDTHKHTRRTALRVATEIAPSQERERSLPIGLMMLGDFYCNTRLESRV